MVDLYCRAVMNYAVSDAAVDSVEVDIHNARSNSELAWEAAGFELIEHESQVSDWTDEAEIAQYYYAEMEAEAKALTGCDHALIGGHILRNPTEAAKHLDYAPIQYVHSDFTHTYGDLVKGRYTSYEPFAQKALDRAGIDASAVTDASRILILQFWRNVGPVEMDLPLAFCDARSVPEEDLVSFHVPEYGGDSVPFDTFGVSKPELEGAHRWYVFPELDVNEAVAFRTYDSERAANGAPFWTPHSAFADPLVHGPRARHSIEVRATCLFA
ncbi:MAG: CmcJ/NvfI family oxidoreductase [Pseudomonadota bacterium]